MKITREYAVEIARIAAYKHGYHHGYMPPNPADFEPHEWVVEAIMNAYAQGQNNPGPTEHSGHGARL